ncbi:histidine phosphatase family protein [Metabacillus halosaccharovorans]|uniref:histidine phosphatase family protein n=1 Tax=Metabacillus halosaccharovorans TaxID=930124 RepID=UPI00203F566E|nr:histidine phosphatase family protein [Metabacillus halosaccharovorans]MCM3439616.1 phosphoglycerate mutase family protein [Metabacillus halosaccharovorans]
MKNIYLVRHCEAEGQHPESPLTEIGHIQALELSRYFSHINIHHIISSPYKRAIESIQPLANRLNLKVEVNKNLTERVLSSNNLTDWLDKLKLTYDDMEIKYEGGESSQEAMNRILEIVEEVFENEENNTIIVTHGNLISLLLKHYNNKFGFDDWRNLTNPDVFLLKLENRKVTYKRLWK